MGLNGSYPGLIARSFLCLRLVCGAILGTQSNRDVEVLNSFELLFAVNADGVIVLDTEFFTQKAEQFKEVFKTLDVLVRGVSFVGRADQPTRPCS